jgi:hypothetical protein
MPPKRVRTLSEDQKEANRKRAAAYRAAKSTDEGWKKREVERKMVHMI